MSSRAITTVGRNAIRDFLQSEVADIGIGTDGTDVSTTDTALGNEVLSKPSANQAVGDGREQFEIRLLASEANNNDLRELGLLTAADELYFRLVFAEIPKTSDFEVEFEVTANVRNPE
jgi:hypothetical protein